MTLILDTKFTTKAITLAKDSDLLITESSFLENSQNGIKKAKEYKHLTAKQAATIAKESKSKKLILTHYSQKYNLSPKTLLEEAKKTFKNTFIIEDLDKTIV